MIDRRIAALYMEIVVKEMKGRNVELLQLHSGIDSEADITVCSPAHGHCVGSSQKFSMQIFQKKKLFVNGSTSPGNDLKQED